jgi:hypothetical protein
MAQKCSWIKRAHANNIDIWRLRLRICSPCSDVTLLRSVGVDRISNPILFNVAEAYDLFLRCYSTIGSNLLVTPIFLNRSVCRLRFDKKLLDIDFFGKQFYNNHRNEIRKLTINDFFSGPGFKTPDEFRSMNLPFNMNTWMSLRSAVILAKKNIPNTVTPPLSLNSFLSRIKRGSKAFRNVIDRSVYQHNKLTDLFFFFFFSIFLLPLDIT